MYNPNSCLPDFSYSSISCRFLLDQVTLGVFFLIETKLWDSLGKLKFNFFYDTCSLYYSLKRQIKNNISCIAPCSSPSPEVCNKIRAFIGGLVSIYWLALIIVLPILWCSDFLFLYSLVHLFWDHTRNYSCNLSQTSLLLGDMRPWNQDGCQAQPPASSPNSQARCLWLEHPKGRLWTWKSEPLGNHLGSATFQLCDFGKFLDLTKPQFHL